MDCKRWTSRATRRIVALLLGARLTIAAADRNGQRRGRPARLQADIGQVGSVGVLVGGHFSASRQRTAPSSPSSGLAALELPRASLFAGSSIVSAVGEAERRRSGRAHAILTRVVGTRARLVCGYDDFAPDEACPDACPYAAEVEDKFCHFKCVQANECGTSGTMAEATIPDLGAHECRRCKVEGCHVCVHGKPGEGTERCAECMPGYMLHGEGRECVGASDWLFGSALALGGLVGLMAMLWYVDLRLRPEVNPKGVAEGEAHRSRQKTRQAHLPGEPLWPMSTDLTTVDVGGFGTIVFFRFQAAVLIWAASGFMLQLLLGLVTSIDIFRIGLRPAATPQQFCAVISWGRNRQMDLIWVKVAWLAIFYPLSFVGAMYYGYSTLKLHRAMDSQEVTMSDFVAVVVGVPPRSAGGGRLEEDLKQAVEEASGEEVVGVSCMWDFRDEAVEHAVLRAVDADIEELEERLAKVPSVSDKEDGVAWERSYPLRIFDWVTVFVLRIWDIRLAAPGEKADHAELRVGEVLDGIQSTDRAFVVFNTQQGRDRALDKLRAGFPIGAATLTLEVEENEPESVVWEHAGVGSEELRRNIRKAIAAQLLCITLWTVLLYLPYERYMASFSYANGDEPKEEAELIFTALVVGAQVGLFATASSYSHNAGFIYEDNSQVFYIILYNSALIVNLVLDLGLTCVLSYHQMKGRGVRTADGRLLDELETAQQVFESYPMQKSVGNQLLHYCFPATFFLPFALEPLVTNWFPTHVARLIVGSHPKIRGRKAERALGCADMEQGRYADVMFNAILACFTPFVSPGYMLPIFGSLAFSHVVIYMNDHVRVLRSMKRFFFSSNVCNLQGQKIFAIPCGVLAAALVFKRNQMLSDRATLGSGPMQGFSLLLAMCAAFSVHVVLHWFCIDVVIPLFVRSEVKPAEEPYAACAARTMATWFSTNPVHCLRSKYVYEHSPPQAFYVVGKEHLLQKNPEIGAYFEVTAAEVAQRDVAAGSGGGGAAG